MVISLKRCLAQGPGRTQRHGFTLIELLVVMAVVALLLSIAMPRFGDSLERSKEAVLKEDLRVMRHALDQFHADKGRYPESLDELVENRYLRAVPVDPVTESSRSWLVSPPKDAGGKGVADVRSGAVGKAKSGTAYESL